MTYQVEFTKKANKQFQALPSQIRKRIAPKIEQAYGCIRTLARHLARNT